MKRFSVIVFTAVMSLTAFAQGQFGYIDYQKILERMPSYQTANEAYLKIVSDYEAEAERNDKEFQRQYIDYLRVQSQLSSTILQKRQKELMLLSENSLSFKKKRSEMLSSERDSLMAPVRAELSKAINDVANILKLDYVIDSSDGCYLYIGSNGVDISEQVCGILKISNAEPADDKSAQAE